MSVEAEFLPGLELSRVFYDEAVLPLLESRFPRLRHSAALIGAGSEVQGFDTTVSTDHGWGPRLQLFLDAGDLERHGAELTAELSRRLPATVRGWPTRFRKPDTDTSYMLQWDPGTGEPRVEVVDSDSWFREQLGVDATRDLDAREWLCVPQQYLAEVTAGEVFHDGLEQLGPIRNRLAWYPDEVWRYLLACQWQKLSQEEPFVGRTAQVGDELGSAVVAARQVREVMRLALLMARRYASYSKWLGTAFTRYVPGSREIGATLRAAMATTSIAEREARLCDAYEELARWHNALGLTAELDPHRRPFHDRPFPVLGAERFAVALRETLTDPELKRLPLTGAVDQWADNTDYIAQAPAIAASVSAL
ncbi:MAG: DUF4037 domain-containing protein [Stackebrandtia sp.]